MIFKYMFYTLLQVFNDHQCITKYEIGYMHCMCTQLNFGTPNISISNILDMSNNIFLCTLTSISQTLGHPEFFLGPIEVEITTFSFQCFQGHLRSKFYVLFVTTVYFFFNFAS